MKKQIVNNIMLLAAALLTAGLFGCDEEKDDNTLVMAALAGAQTWEIVAPLNGATGVSQTPTFVFKSNCELDTAYDVDEDYADLTYDGGMAEVRLSSSTCVPVTIDGDTVTMTLTLGAFPPNMDFGPVVIHGFPCKSPRVSKKQYAFEEYSFTTGSPD